MIEEREFVDSINYRDNGYIEVRKVLQVLRDGVEISRQYHRHVVDPDQEDLSSEDDKVKAIAQAMDAHRKEKAVEKKKREDEMMPPVNGNG